MDIEKNKKNFHWKKALIFTLLISILATLLILNYVHDFINVENIKNFVNSFGPYSMTVFVLIYILITLFGFSAAIFTILAGTLFGVGWGLFLVVVAATVAAGIAFYIARYFSHKLASGTIKNKTMQNIISKIEKNCEKNGFMAIAILRLSFMPYIPLSYGAGVVKTLKFRDFILATFLTNIFGSFVFIFLGASITQSLPLFIGAIILLILFMQTPKLIKKWEKKKLKN